MRASTQRAPYLSKTQRMFLFGIVGTAAVLGGASLIATSCLDRGRSTHDVSTTTVTSGEMERGSTVDDSTGGTRALSTAIATSTATSTATSNEALPGGAPVTEPTNASTEPSTSNTSMGMGMSVGTSEAPPPPAGHADHQSYDPNAQPTPMPAAPMTAPATTETPPPPATTGDGGTSSVGPAPTTSSNGAAPPMSRAQAVTGANTPTVPAETRSPSFAAGAGKFVTEAPPDRASAWTSNPESGAGPFTTDRSSPPEPIWYGAPSGTQAPR